MSEVAKMFGKKLGEPFIAYELGKNGNHIGNHVMFSERGVVYVDVPEDKQDWLLICLLTGEAEIKEFKQEYIRGINNENS